MTKQQNDSEASFARRVVFTRGARFFVWSFIVLVLISGGYLLQPQDALVAEGVITAICLTFYIRQNGLAQSGPTLLFATTMAVFVWARPLIALSSPEFNLRFIEALGGVSVSQEGLQVYYAVLITSMAAFSATLLSCMLPSRANLNVYRPNEVAFSGSDLFTWQFFFLVGAIASFLQSVLYLRYFLTGGSYYDLYIGGADAVGFPGLSFAASLLFYGYLGILLSLTDDQSSGASKRRWRWTMLFIGLSIFGLARGSRGEVFTQLLAGLWLFSFTRNRAVSLKGWVFFGAGLFALSQLVGALRQGDAAQSDNLLTKALEWFVYTQGLSGELVAVASENFGVGPSNLRFIFSPLLAPLRRIFDPQYGIQTASHGVSSGLLADVLAFRLAPDYYLAGHGAGSSYLAETYCALGLLGVLAGTAFLTWIVLRGPQLSTRSQSALFVFAGSLPYILFTPRESMVFAIVPALKAIALLIVCRRLQKSLYLLRLQTNL